MPTTVEHGPNNGMLIDGLFIVQGGMQEVIKSGMDRETIRGKTERIKNNIKNLLNQIDY